MRKKINRIIITGDCLRPKNEGGAGGANTNILWLYHTINYQIQLACGITPDYLVCYPTQIDAINIFQKLGYDDLTTGWTSIYDSCPQKEYITETYAKYFEDSLFICFELPPYLKEILIENNVPYIDFHVHPVRFLDDLVMAVHSSSSLIQSNLRALSISQDYIYMTANLRKATVNYFPKPAISDNSLLVAGQCRFDASQIIKGSFYSIDAQKDDILEFCSQYDTIVLKPHPYDNSFPLIEFIANNHKNTVFTKDNIYYLLAQPSIKGLLTVNSSVSTEAKFFDKNVTTLIPAKISLGYASDELNPANYFCIENLFLEPDFWRDILGHLTPTSPKDNFKVSTKPNRIRTALGGNFWDFNKIDTDIFVNKSTAINFDLATPKINAINVEHSLIEKMCCMQNIAYKKISTIEVRKNSPQGLAIFGPYISLKKGAYLLKIITDTKNIENYSAPIFGVDICTDLGTKVIQKKDFFLNKEALKTNAQTLLNYEYFFELPEDVEKNLECRIWHYSNSDLKIKDILLIKKQ